MFAVLINLVQERRIALNNFCTRRGFEHWNFGLLFSCTRRKRNLAFWTKFFVILKEMTEQVLHRHASARERLKVIPFLTDWRKKKIHCESHVGNWIWMVGIWWGYWSFCDDSARNNRLVTFTANFSKGIALAGFAHCVNLDTYRCPESHFDATCLVGIELHHHPIHFTSTLFRLVCQQMNITKENRIQRFTVRWIRPSKWNHAITDVIQRTFSLDPFRALVTIDRPLLLSILDLVSKHLIETLAAYSILVAQ